MTILGAHVSIAGGIQNSVARALEIQCDAFQIFTKNQRQWKAPPLDPEAIGSFKQQLKDSGIGPVIAHDSYLINLGAPKEEIFQRSIVALADELSRCSTLSIPYLVAHPGSHLGEGEKRGIERIAEGIDSAWPIYQESVEGPDPMILLETTAGQGTNLGYRFEQLAEIRERTSIPGKLGVCLDTCHVFSAGYDLSSSEGYNITMDEFKRILTMDSLKAIHINDSKKDLGSKVDRHTNIGEGTIGLEGFELILNDDRTKNIPMILETPGGEEAYIRDLRLLRSLTSR
jgi:deoxyribonuclease-4